MLAREPSVPGRPTPHAAAADTAGGGLAAAQLSERPASLLIIINFIHRKNFDSSINKEKIQKKKETR